MPKNISRLAKAIRRQSRTAPLIYGVYQGAESVDANLSQVLVPGAGIDGRADTHRFVPRGKHVTGLTPGDVVLCGGSPLCIIAVVVGNISLAEI